MSTNIIKQFDKNEFSENYQGQCKENNNGDLECSDEIEHNNDDLKKCYNYIKKYDAYASKKLPVGQCVNKLYTALINDKLQVPSSTNFLLFYQNGKTDMVNACNTVGTAANSINSYCNNAISEDPNLTAPETNTIIYNAINNGNGQKCPNDNIAIKTPLTSKYTFNNQYTFEGQPVPVPGGQIGCHQMKKLKRSCNSVKKNSDIQNLLNSYISGRGLDWNNFITKSDKENLLKNPTKLNQLNKLDSTIANIINSSDKVTVMDKLSNLFKSKY